MKNFQITLIVLFTFLTSFATGQNKEMFFKEANTFFSTYVEDGKVNYAALKQSTMLPIFINDIANTKLATLAPSIKKAYAINAYNLLVINQVVQNYPLSSVQETGNFFEKSAHIIGGNKMSLNQFEKEMILGANPDPRLHFVLVCGAVGCPPITNFAYTPDQLEEQLDSQTRSALNDPAFLEPNGTHVNISKIFEWYAKDFGPNKQARIDFINQFVDKKIPAATKFNFVDYDWSLNDNSSSTKAATAISANSARYVVSSTIPKGTAELKLFNNLYTQRANRDTEGGQRNNFFTSTFSALYGVNKRFNAGLELKYRRVSNTLLPSSALTVFGGDEEDILSRRNRFTGIGPKIRWAPTAALPNFSIQSTFQIGLGEELKGNGVDPFIDWQGAIWYTQFFNDFTIGSNFSVFTEIDFWLEDIGNAEEGFANRASTPATLIFSYFPNPKTTFYVLGGYSPFWQSEFDYFYQVGAGAKYQFNPNFELELLVTDFNNKGLAASNGQAATFNLGIRYNIQ